MLCNFRMAADCKLWSPPGSRTQASSAPVLPALCCPSPLPRVPSLLLTACAASPYSVKQPVRQVKSPCNGRAQCSKKSGRSACVIVVAPYRVDRTPRARSASSWCCVEDASPGQQGGAYDERRSRQGFYGLERCQCVEVRLAKAGAAAQRDAFNDCVKGVENSAHYNQGWCKLGLRLGCKWRLPSTTLFYISLTGLSLTDWTQQHCAVHHETQHGVTVRTGKPVSCTYSLPGPAANIDCRNEPALACTHAFGLCAIPA